MSRLACTFLLALSLVPSGLIAGNAVVVGVLEIPQCNEKGGVRVRALFAKTEKNWISLDNAQVGHAFLTARMEWTITYNGRILGSFKTTDPGFSTEYQWTYPRDRFLDPVSSQSLPAIKNVGNRFYGWCSTPENRPLIVLSRASASDPSRWLTAVLGMKDKERLFGEFQKAAGRALICPKDPEIAVPFNYSLNDIEIVSCFKDKDGRQLVTLRLRPTKESENCDGVLDNAWDQHTFLLSSKVTYLGVGLELVGAGDFDGDGQSELLFWHTGYDEDGYMLFSSDFKRKIKYFWGYH